MTDLQNLACKVGALELLVASLLADKFKSKPNSVAQLKAFRTRAIQQLSHDVPKGQEAIFSSVIGHINVFCSGLEKSMRDDAVKT